MAIYSINDIEKLSGIKAHTIRIWEKRYNLFTPNRTSGNSRYYDQDSLQKLLNVVLLNNNNYKISKIAAMSDEDIIVYARELAHKKDITNDAINSFKIAMYNFDQNLFNQVYAKLLINKSFPEIFKETFIPLLEFIGLLWQTKSLAPAHEHFISNLISQKIQINTERITLKHSLNKRVFVLYLPENEIHELGLQYLNYELTLRGNHTVYLGQSVPIQNLLDVQNVFNDICFISYFTVEPQEDKLIPYFEKVLKIIENTSNSFWAIGKRTQGLEIENLTNSIKTFSSTLSVLKELEN